MRNNHIVYRWLLRLYPREFQAEYSESMVQTLTDMLQDQPTKLGRIIVWLRVGIELPFYACKELFNSIGENNMHKPSFFNKRFAIIASVLITIIALVLARSWIKNTALSGMATLVTKGKSSQQLESENQSIGNPFTQLTTTKSNNSYICNTVTPPNIKLGFMCDASRSVYFKLGQSETDKTALLSNVARIENDLQKAGYMGGSNGVTLTSLVAGTYEGKDYSPDAFYQRVDGINSCMFDVNIGYSKPALPAVSMQLSCTRYVGVFGSIDGNADCTNYVNSIGQKLYQDCN